MYFFAPETLSGYRIPYGLRKEMLNLYKISLGFVITKNLSEAIFLYKNYKDFRENVEKICNEIKTRLGT